MRFSLFALFLLLAASCTVFDKNTPADDAPRQTPQTLPAPEYDPATSPTPMTENTVLPRPDASPPATYQTSKGTDPANSTNVPAQYGAPAGAMVGSSSNAAPTPYGQPPIDPDAEIYDQLAATLTGLWVNQADPKEVVEFATDHYTTFYDGKKLFREPLTFHVRCPGSCNNGVEMEISCFTIAGPARTDCFGIVRLSQEVLEMSLLGVSTETVIYRRQVGG